MATSRACAPSCRSRSIRRSSAAWVSTASARVWVRCFIRASTWAGVGASRTRDQRACSSSSFGAIAKPRAISRTPRADGAQRMPSLPLWTWMKPNQSLKPWSTNTLHRALITKPYRPSITRARGRNARNAPTTGSTSTHAPSRQNAGSVPWNLILSQ